MSILSGAENFFESHREQLESAKWALEPIAFVQFSKKLQNQYLNENPLSIRVSGLFCTSKDVDLRLFLQDFKY